MSTKAIEVSLAKIDYNLGKPYLYVDASCPYGYYLTAFYITVYQVDATGQWTEKYYDIINAIQQDETPVVDLRMTMPISILEDIEGPAIYKIKLVADPDLDLINEDAVIDDKLFLSDVYGIYRQLLNGLLNSDHCNPLSDDLVKQYLMLYGHQQALHDGDLDVAKELFKLLHKGFSKCGNVNKPSINCGCYDRH